MFLVILAVICLYSKISNHKEIKAAKEALNFLKRKSVASKAKTIITFLFLILTLNNFIFNGFQSLPQDGMHYGYNLRSTLC